MKKAIKIGAFAFAGALLFASCKKNFTCECVGSYGTKEKKAKGKDAESACKDAATKVAGIPTEVCTEKK